MTATPDALLTDLGAVGVAVQDVWDLVDSGRTYPAAVPVLVSWLDRIDELPRGRARESLREGILHALAVPYARPSAAPSVIRQFHVLDDPSGAGTGWVAGSALGVVADASVADDVVGLLLDRGLGRAREMIFEAVPRIAGPRPDVVDAVRSLLDDESVRPFVIATLGALRDTASRTAVAAYLKHPHPLVRRQAERTVRRLDEELVHQAREREERLARYLKRLASMASGEPTVYRFRPVAQDGDEILSIVYLGVPGPGFVTGFTYGLSLAHHPEWTDGGRELAMTVRSSDPEWGKVPGRIAVALQGRHAFTIGDALGYAARLVEGSPMTCVLLAPPAVPVRRSPVDDPIEIVGMYPIHAAELDLVYTAGVDALWELAWDRFDPQRDPVA